MPDVATDQRPSGLRDAVDRAASRVESSFEALLFGSRWILAPFYLGLVIMLAVMLVKFVQELFHTLAGVFTITDTDAILAMLTLVDLSLAGNLLLMVIFAGYENFVSKIGVDH